MMRNKWDPGKSMELISKEIQIDLIFTLCVNLQMHPIQVTVELVFTQFLEIINTKPDISFKHAPVCGVRNVCSVTVLLLAISR